MSNEMTTESKDQPIFDRVVSILDQARGNVVRAVNSNMVTAYWLIGREIVQELQGGEVRAGYGKQVVEDLSKRLTERYGKGYSAQTLWKYRLFYQVYADRISILSPAGTEFGSSAKLSPVGIESEKQSSAGSESVLPAILHPAGGESGKGHPAGDELKDAQKSSPPGTELTQTFSPQLSWSHYRALMRVKEETARDFYECEAIEGGWDKRTLERQIHTQYYERCLHSQQSDKMIAEGRKLQKTAPSASETLKNPYVLEFLGYPNFAELHESDVEQAIITHLQRFLLELGNGFAFVARQKHIRIEEDDRFIDLVFYHCKLKFYLLIDLKLGKLTHADVGQMDGYVRMFDGLFTAPDDNPTIGLILCTEKCDTVARYSVLNDRKQIFASKYLPHLPSEEQLQIEIERERRLLEAAVDQNKEANES
jgi:predicted nuclease of restriction endonuclease-like (RecB) superfamily